MVLNRSRWNDECARKGTYTHSTPTVHPQYIHGIIHGRHHYKENILIDTTPSSG